MCIVKGRRHSILFAELADGSVPGREFFQSLADETQAKLLAYFRHVADNGKEGAFNKLRFRREQPPYYAFKTKGWTESRNSHGLIRFPCFCHHDLLVITHGFWKPRQKKWPETEYTRADTIRQEWLKLNTSDT